MRRRALVVAAACAGLALVVACGGKPAAAPSAGGPSDCAEVVGRINQYGNTLVLTSQEESARSGIASALRTVHVVKRSVSDLDAALAPLSLKDPTLRTRVEAYRATARDLVKSTDEVSQAIEATAAKLGPHVSEVLSSSRALDEACEAKGAGCEALKQALGSASTGSIAWDDMAAVAKLRTSLDGAPPKGAAARRAEARMLDAVDGLITAVHDTDRLGGGPMKHFKTASTSTKQAVDDVRQYCGEVPAAVDAREWVSADKEDLRALTVVVRFKPPGSLVSDFEAAARSATQEEYGALYRAAAAGGFGSGFVVVRGAADGPRAFIITNRHVVDLADHATVVRSDGTALRARIVYSDPHYDLAVLMLDGDAKVFDHGFAFETAPAKDQQAVVATGFPGLANEPSYQITKGYVSNDRFELDADGLKLPYIQHTAPIDRGSSGGPLMNDAGRVLGVNTLKAFGRENVAFAAPASAVIDAIRYASTLDTRFASPDFRRQTFRDDCLDLVAELASAHPRTGHAEQLVSTRMIAEQGLESYNLQAPGDDELQKLWEEDPVSTLRFAVVRRVWKEVIGAGGIDATETCAAPNPADWQQIMTTDRVRIPLRVAAGKRDIVMRWEQGRWKLARMEFVSQVPAPAEPEKKGKASRPKRTRAGKH